MTDEKLQELINSTIEHKIKYHDKLVLLEAEYTKRIGFNPSDIDDDYFIDIFHYAQGGKVTVKTVIKNAKIVAKKAINRIDLEHEIRGKQ